MPNLSIKDNNGFIPYTKTYKEDYLSFETILNGLGIISEYEEEFFHIITAIWKWSRMVSRAFIKNCRSCYKSRAI